MARRIERHGYAIGDDGVITHDDRPTTYEALEAIAGRRLDHRRNYCLIDGKVCESISWTEPCSGCKWDGPGDHGAAGCEECGYTGKCRSGMWVSVDDDDFMRELERTEPTP